MECDHCVLQWHYHTANTWGTDEDGTGTGHGYQEEFYGCADVEIVNTGNAPIETTPATFPSTTTPITTTTTTTTTTKTTTTKTTTTTKSTTKTPSNPDNTCAGGGPG